MPVPPSPPLTSRRPDRRRESPLPSDGRSRPRAPCLVSSALSRAALEANGFEGKAGQVLAVPTSDGLAVAIGIGDPGSIDVAGLRSAAAAFARAASKHAQLATNLADVEGVDARSPAQAVTEGVLLASYRYIGPQERAVERRRSSRASRCSPGTSGPRRSTGAPSVVRSSPRPRHSLANWPTPRPPTSTPRISPPRPSTSARRPVCTSRCSTRTSSSRWGAVGCSV